MVSMIVPTMARTPLVGYRLVVLAIVATGFFSFGLWVHHMFATGIPQLSLSFFSAASMAVSIPSGIQVFAWIATIAAGRLRLTVPALFILGRSEEHTSELQSLMRISYAVFCLKKKNTN